MCDARKGRFRAWGVRHAMPGTVVAKCLEWNGGGSAVSILVGSGLGDALMVPVYRPDLVFGCAERGAFAHVFRNKECIFFFGGRGY